MDNDDAVVWAAVRAEYESGESTVVEICRRHCVSRPGLYRRIHDEGWPPRRAKVTTEGLRARSNAALVARLLKAIGRQLGEIEQRLNGDGDADGAMRDASERERDARTLASLVRTLERLCALGTLRGKAAAQSDLEPNLAKLRQALARRIARLAAQGTD